MRLPRPFPHLDPHGHSRARASKDPSFATCRTSPGNHAGAGTGTTPPYLHDSLALLSARRADPPTLCASASVPPSQTGRPPQNHISHFRTRSAAAKNHHSHPSGSKPRSTGSASTTTFAHAKTALAMGTIGLLALLTVACGSEEASPTPDDDQPAAVSVANQGQEQGSDQAGSRHSERPTAGDGSGARGGQQPSENTATAEPTATPRPTPDRSPTDTPKPTPTVTMAPTPTPDPMGPMFNLLRGHWDDPFNQPFREFHEYNVELIKLALTPPMVDFFVEQYPDGASFHSRTGLESIALGMLEIDDSRGTAFEHLPSDDGKLHFKVNFSVYVPVQGDPVYQGSVNAAADLVPPQNQDDPIPQADELEAVTDQAPVFSGLTSEPVMEPAQ